jgi:cysteinyl-tRNA synthetase
MPYLRVLSTFRDGVRRLAMEKTDQSLKNILSLCDKLRDEDLVPFGVALDDQDGESQHAVKLQLSRSTIDGKALIKLVPPEDLVKARNEKQALREAKAARKAAADEAERQKRMERLEKGRIAPQHMFKPPHIPDGTYGSWNEAGIPLTDAHGNELGKNQTKRLQKDWESQKRVHEEFLIWERAQEH